MSILVINKIIRLVLRLFILLFCLYLMKLIAENVEEMPTETVKKTLLEDTLHRACSIISTEKSLLESLLIYHQLNMI